MLKPSVCLDVLCLKLLKAWQQSKVSTSKKWWTRNSRRACAQIEKESDNLCAFCLFYSMWPSEGCCWLVVSNAAKWKIDTEGFKPLLSWPQLFGWCFGDRAQSCSTQSPQVMAFGELGEVRGSYRKICKCCTILALQRRCMRNTCFIDE